jgi:predicted secreted protein
MELERRVPIKAYSGETIEVSAPGEGIGGFLWHAEVSQQAATIVSEALGPAGEGVGATREKVFRVRLEQPGDTTVRLVQKRPWESTPSRIIEVPIRCA